MSNQTLSAGFCRLDITPPLGIRLRGYYTIREAEGILDPLYVNALAFSDGTNTAVVMVCDLLGIYGPAAYEWPDLIAEHLGLPKEAVFLCHTHTHTGPTVAGYREPNDEQYDAWLLRRLKDAAVMAVRDLKPVTKILAGEDIIPDTTFVRRFQMKDGHYQTWGSPVEEILRPACDGDESMRAVCICREDAPQLMLVNFQLHPDCIGGCLISADYPGVVRKNVEKAIPDTFCVYFDGAEGQMIATNALSSVKIKGYPKAVQRGESIAAAVSQLYPKMQVVEGDALRFERGVVIAPTKRDDSRIPEAEHIIALHEAGRDSEIDCPKWLKTPIVAEAYVLQRLQKEDCNEIPLNVSVVAFGPLALVGFPGEPFCEVGLRTRAGSPYPVTFACCQTNGCEGYYPTAEAYDQGGYEPRNSRLKKGAAELLVAKAVETLQKLSEQA